MLLSVALMILDHRYHKLDQARAFLSYVVYPVQWTIHAPRRFAYHCHDYFLTKKTLISENRHLTQEQFLLNAKLQKLNALEAENLRLHSLLQSSPRAGEQLAVAEIIQVDSDPFNHTVLLNKGKNQGVYVGQPIIDGKGVMGAIVEANDKTSRAILVTDASHAIPIENLRNGVRGIVVGTGSMNCLELQYVPTTADIKVGDTLVTSGLGGRYPPGYPVGTITQIEQEHSESFANVRVFPAAQLERGRQVLLVLRGETEEKNVPSP